MAEISMPYILIFLITMTPLWSHAHSADWELCAAVLKGAGIRANLPNPRQRQMAQGLELLKLKPPEAGNLRVMVVDEEIKELSRSNLTRLLSEIPEPPLIRLSPEDRARLEEMTASLSFLGVLPLAPEMIGPIEPTADFYSQLIGGSKTVGVKVVATPTPTRLESLQGILYKDHIRADADFVRQFGFVVPGFANASQVWNFYNQWQPDVLPEIVKRNRYNLPAQIKTPEEFAQYLSTPGVAAQVFPDHALPDRLAPAKENLHRYLLTVPDAEVFYRHALLVYLQLKIEVGYNSMNDIERLWRIPGQAGLLLQNALQAYGWPEGAEIRLPLNLPRYYILRYSEIRPKDPRTEFRKDSRRLDHKQMP